LLAALAADWPGAFAADRPGALAAADRLDASAAAAVAKVPCQSETSSIAPGSSGGVSTNDAGAGSGADDDDEEEDDDDDDDEQDATGRCHCLWPSLRK
jgi:hypothetical protein